MSGIRLQQLPQYPSNVVGTLGIDVIKASGNWTIQLGYEDLPIVSPYTPQANHWVIVYDANAKNYFLVPATSFHL